MNPLDIRGATFCAIDHTLAAGTTTTYTTTGVAHYCINGLAYTAAAVTNAATPTTDANGNAFTAVAANQGSVFVMGLNAAGAIKVMQGEVTALNGATDGASATFETLPDFPSLPADFCPFGYFIVKVGASGAAWTFGASNLAGPPANTGISATSVMVLPNRPQSS